MINTKFEAYKLNRELKKNGKEYTFERAKLNSFKEPTDDNCFVHKLNGLYHEQNNYVSITSSDSAQARAKVIPMILCLYDETKLLKVDDIVKINSKKLKVTGITNIQEWNIIADISLEVVDDVV